MYLKENGNPGLIDGYTPDSFFISWSTIWRSKCVMRLEKPSKTDPHSRNVPCVCAFTKHRYFYQAFDIKENDGMFIAPEKRGIW
jgi:predicted metalloendopeptidase